ncbi:MAG: histidine kinase N-terminal domain-containing protein [Chloroflexi bacterium]|nr:histidine kinase N-terminal domain-containing protein [Chloroflexota bacterium]
MAIPADVASDLDSAAAALIERIIPNLNLLADLLHADVLLFARAGSQVEVLAHAQPVPVPSVYQDSLTGRRLRREQVLPIARLLYQGRPSHEVQGAVVGGVPIVREVIPVRAAGGHIVAALATETAVIEHERFRKRDSVPRRAILRVRDLVARGRLDGGQNIGRLGIHDGILVIDANGLIQYASTAAEGFYRLLGYVDSLVHTQLSELETNEYIAFRSMETGVCLEQRVAEQDRVWIKKVVPLMADETPSLISRLPGTFSRHPVGAIVIIQDVTDEYRKEQELKVKSAMIQEIHHRVKNNLQTITALLRLQARRAPSPEVAETLMETVGRIMSVAVVHEFLSKDESSIINIHEVAKRIAQEFLTGTLDPEKKISIQIEGERQFLMPAQQATSCALIVNELIQNAVEHGFAHKSEGTIVIRLLQTEDSMRIEIEDDGEGLPEGFDLSRGGLGLQIIRTLVREDLKGEFQLENGEGVRAVVSFPRRALPRIARAQIQQPGLVPGQVAGQPPVQARGGAI